MGEFPRKVQNEAFDNLKEATYANAVGLLVCKGSHMSFPVGVAGLKRVHSWVPPLADWHFIKKRIPAPVWQIQPHSQRQLQARYNAEALLDP